MVKTDLQGSNSELIETPVWPKITIVTPSFNQGEYLEQTIRSVLLQGYPNLEYIVMDGGSQDGSVDIISRYAPQLNYWVSERDGGQSDAIARGLSRATGEILAWLNSDDILLPGALRAVASAFSTNRDVGVVYGNRLYIDSAGKEIGRQWPPTFIPDHSWSLGQQLCQEAVFWRRSVYERVGGVDAKLFFIMDFHLFYRMSRVSTFTKTREYLGGMRVHPGTKTAKHENVMWDEFRIAKSALGIPEGPRFFNGCMKFLTKQLSRFERLVSVPMSNAEFERWRGLLQSQRTG